MAFAGRQEQGAASAVHCNHEMARPYHRSVQISRGSPLSGGDASGFECTPHATQYSCGKLILGVFNSAAALFLVRMEFHHAVSITCTATRVSIYQV